MTSYALFLSFLLLYVIYGIEDHKKKQRTWYFNLVALWVLCYTFKLCSQLSQVLELSLVDMNT